MNKIQTTQETKEMIEGCSTKSILESDLTELKSQLKQVKSNMSLIKKALKKPETEEEFQKKELEHTGTQTEDTLSL